MSISTEVPDTETSVLYSSLSSKPPKIVKAKGHYLYTEDGHAILDASGGAAVSCIGHGHPRVKKAIMEQMDAVEYCFAPWFTTDAYEKLANFLCKSTGGVMEKVFVIGSGLC